MGVPDPKWGQKLVALVSLRPGAHLQTEDAAAIESVLIQTCRDGLAAYKAPKRIWVVPEIPRGANGKADYRWARSAAETLDRAAAPNA